MFRSSACSLSLATRVPLEVNGLGVHTEFTIHEGETLSFVLAPLDADEDAKPCPSEGEMESSFDDTVNLLAALAQQMHVPGPLARDGSPFGVGP